MIFGRVTGDGREAAITLRLFAPGPVEDERSAEIRAVIDSGFLDHG